MTITRNIGGAEVAFTLTPEELTRAYYEQEKHFDMEVMKSVIVELEDTDFTDLRTTRAEVLSLLPSLADKYREALDNQYSEFISYSDTFLNTLYYFFKARTRK